MLLAALDPNRVRCDSYTAHVSEDTKPGPDSTAAQRSRRTAHVVGLTAEGRMGLLLLGGVGVWALAQGDYLVFLLTCLIGGTLIAARSACARNLRGLEVDRRLPDRGRVGTPVSLLITVQRAGGKRDAVGVSIEDRLPRGVRPSVLRLDCPLVARSGTPGAPTRVRTTIRPARRGRLRLEGVLASSRYPLGVARSQRRLLAPVGMLVHPAEGRPTAYLRQQLRGRDTVESARTQYTRGDDQFHGVQEFREGDDPRRIHWRSTARAGTLIRTDWRRDEGEAHLLVLGNVHGEGPRATAHFERAVSVTATLWREMVRAGRPGQLVISPDLPVIDAQRSGALRAGLDLLAELPVRDARDLAAAVRRARRTPGRSSLILVAAGSADPARKRLQTAAGEVLVLRADRASIRRYVKGLA